MKRPPAPREDLKDTVRETDPVTAKRETEAAMDTTTTGVVSIIVPAIPQRLSSRQLRL